MEVERGWVTLDSEPLGAVKKLSSVGAGTYKEYIDDTPDDRGEGAANDEIMGPVSDENVI